MLIYMLLTHANNEEWLWKNEQSLIELCGIRNMGQGSLVYSPLRIASIIYNNTIYTGCEDIDAKTEYDIYYLKLEGDDSLY